MFKLNPVTQSMAFHMTMKSANVKTGPIPVSTSSRDTCAIDCPFKGFGCYAESGPLALHWNAVTANLRGFSFVEFCACVASFDDGQLWRMNQAGDLPHVGGLIDAGAVAMLVEANQGKRGFTYTHHDVIVGDNLDVITLANISGFTINLSANDLEHADTLAATGLPVCVVLPIDQADNLTTPAGHKVVVCPAAIRDNVSCMTCQLCQRADRTVIVGFPSHGTGAKKADSVARRTIVIKSI
jgi:hypothetical protein